MLRMYLEFAKKSFQNNIVYRLDTLLSIINTVISIFVYIAIWTAIFRVKGTINGFDLKMVSTHFVISLGLSTVYMNMTGEVSRKVISGQIATDLLKPISFNMLMFSKTLGQVLYKLAMQFIPAFIVSYFFLGILLPHSAFDLLLFLISLALGFLACYFIDFIVSISAFWLHHVFFLEQIKNAVITILSGALLPIWFLPGFVARIITFTPFESIYFIPISLYLGRLSSQQIIIGLAKQVGWVIALCAISQFISNAAMKKVVIQGG